MVYEFGQTETENITTIAKIDAERESDQDRAWRLERAAMPKICYLCGDDLRDCTCPPDTDH